MKAFSRDNGAKALSSMTISQREAFLLNGVLNPRNKSIDYIAQRDLIGAQKLQLAKQRYQNKLNSPMISQNIVLPSPSSAAHSLMTRSTVTTKDLNAFIGSRYLSPPNHIVDKREKIHSALLDLISASSANNLRTLMQLLAIYWQIGLSGTRPSIYDARRQAEALLLRSLIVHPETQFSGGGEQVGVPDFFRFTQFVSTFYKYMGASPQKDDYLNELLFILLARSGRFQDATRELEQRKFAASDECIGQYIQTAMRQGGGKVPQFALKEAIMKNSLGVLTTKYLLECTTIDEFKVLLDFIDMSPRRGEIYNDVQHLIVRAACHSHKNWPLTVLVMERIRQNAGLYPRSLIYGLEGALAAKNKNATRLLLLELDEFHEKPQTIEFEKHRRIQGDPNGDIVRQARDFILQK